MLSELKSAYLFSQLDESQLERVAAMSSEISLGDGDLLFEAG